MSANPMKTLQSSGSRAGPLAQHITALGPWFHNLHLPDGSQTAPDHPLGDFPACKWQELGEYLPADLHGCRALDIGCNAGFYSFELARRGADVLAIDHDIHYLDQARWAAQLFGLEQHVAFRQGDVYALAQLGESFDLVLFLGVFYHLRHPLLGLDLAAAACRDQLLFQSLATAEPQARCTTDDPGFEGRDALHQDGWPKLAFIEHELAGDPSNWWVPNPPAAEALVRSAGFSVEQRLGEDVLACRRTPDADAAQARLRETLQQLRGSHV